MNIKYLSILLLDLEIYLFIYIDTFSEHFHELCKLKAYIIFCSMSSLASIVFSAQLPAALVSYRNIDNIELGWSCSNKFSNGAFGFICRMTSEHSCPQVL